MIIEILVLWLAFFLYEGYFQCLQGQRPEDLSKPDGIWKQLAL